MQNAPTTAIAQNQDNNQKTDHVFQKSINILYKMSIFVPFVTLFSTLIQYVSEASRQPISYEDATSPRDLIFSAISLTDCYLYGLFTLFIGSLGFLIFATGISEKSIHPGKKIILGVLYLTAIIASLYFVYLSIHTIHDQVIQTKNN